MYSYKKANQNRQRSRDPLERRMDQWIETGRQFVDGVAGNRPGQRRRSGQPIGSSLDNVGRWVGDKIDWFFEEEDDWVEPWEQEKRSQTQPFAQKRPLQAISLRGRKSLSPSPSSPSKTFDEDYSDSRESWPDDESFRVNRWERQEIKRNEISNNTLREESDLERASQRPLPRSSRRRN